METLSKYRDFFLYEKYLVFNSKNLIFNVSTFSAHRDFSVGALI